jgi:hypothetical protein
VRVPAYWSKATAEQTDPEGKKRSFSCWRSSDKSPADAHETALAAATSLLQSFLGGATLNRYAYGERALREEIKQRFTNEAGELIAVISQNSYGSLVLSTARVMFIDVDFPPYRPAEAVSYFFKRLLDKSTPSPEARREQDAQAKLKEFLMDRPQSSFRVYRTCAGLRFMATHSLFDPAADSTQALLQSMGSDPLYVRLCKARESFRARLTPKPWRCGHTSNTISWPRETDEQSRRFEKWHAGYLERQSQYATCRYLGSLGDGTIDAEAKTIIDIHDQVTRCHEPLTLA